MEPPVLWIVRGSAADQPPARTTTTTEDGFAPMRWTFPLMAPAEECELPDKAS